jgi:putative transposase
VQVSRGDLAKVPQEGVFRKDAQGDAGHIHMLLSVPPKFSPGAPGTMGYLKGKSAIRIHREVLRTKGTLFGREFWSRGYCVSTVGLNEEQIRQYIRDQEKMQRDLDQGELEFE